VVLLAAALFACWWAWHGGSTVHNNIYFSGDYGAGLALLQKGREADALPYFERAAKANSNDADICEHLGNVLVKLERPGEAMIHLQRAVQLKPDVADNHYNLGNALLLTGRVDEAIAEYKRDLAISPRHGMGQANLGNALLGQGHVDEALAHLSNALAIMPHSALAHAAYANALLQTTKIDQAVDEFEVALKIQPDLLPARNRLEGIAWIWATDPRGKMRNGILAIRLAKDLDQMSGGKDPTILAVLAAAYAELENYPGAESSATQALQIALAQTNTALADQLREEIAVYHSGHPYRQGGGTNEPTIP
jgi:tetratricopeptide (TPR) repeat protein